MRRLFIVLKGSFLSTISWVIGKMYKHTRRLLAMFSRISPQDVFTQTHAASYLVFKTCCLLFRWKILSFRDKNKTMKKKAITRLEWMNMYYHWYTIRYYSVHRAYCMFIILQYIYCICMISESIPRHNRPWKHWVFNNLPKICKTISKYSLSYIWQATIWV